MRKRRVGVRVFAFFLAGVCLMSFPGSSLAGPSDPLASVAAVLRAKQVMIGYGDGDMRWGNTVTRAEAVKLLLAAIGDVAPELSRSAMSYVDVPVTHWAYSHITMATEMGIVRGKPGNVFDPESGVTMAEFAVMVSRVFVGLGSQAGPAASGVRIAPLWAEGEILGWPVLLDLLRDASGGYALDYLASRGEVGSVTWGMMERLGLAYDVRCVLEQVPADADSVVVSLEQGGGRVTLPLTDDAAWFRGDAVVMPATLVGAEVGLVLSDSGKVAVIVGAGR